MPTPLHLQLDAERQRLGMSKSLLATRAQITRANITLALKTGRMHLGTLVAMAEALSLEVRIVKRGGAR
jgi:hypothetical protein